MSEEYIDKNVSEELLRKANASLLRSEDNVQRMMEASPDTVLVVNQNGEILFANSRVEEMFGYSMEEVIGSSVDALIPTAFRKAHVGHRASYAQEPSVTHMSSDFNLLGQKKMGGLVPVDISLSPMQYDNQEVVLATIRNVSEMRAVMESNRQMAAIVEASSDAIFRVSMLGEIEFWSEGAERLYGYKSEEILGKLVEILIPENGEALNANILQKLFKGKVITAHDAKRKHKNGRSIDVSVSIFPIRNSNGDVVGGASIHRNITEVKYLQEQLRHAQKMESAGQLAGGIAHDFNNILTVILGYSTLLIQSVDDDFAFKSQLTAIEGAAQRASSLTRQLLTFSRKQRIDLKLINPKELITDMLAAIKSTLGEKINLKMNLYSSWMVKEDPAQFEQIVLNLVMNARQVMPNGGTISVETTGVAIKKEGIERRPGYSCFTPEAVKPGSYLQLSISDTGSGMSKEVLERIFEPFYTTKPRGEGTGLGLSVVYGMVSQSGGAVHVETRKGVGTCFRVFFPRTLGDIDTTEKSPMPFPAGKGKILLVEDDVGVRNLTRAILKSGGYTVITAEEPKRVLEGDFNEDVDLILSDVVMPGMSGPEFAKIWLKTHPTAKFLFMSGYADDSILSFSSSPDTLIQKPFKPEELLIRINAAINEI